ncbi:MAG: hypothetical protein KC731_11210 [Myxococcales bacterium]|nr:hypothetical protein [Myxococcales bacterium]
MTRGRRWPIPFLASLVLGGCTPAKVPPPVVDPAPSAPASAPSPSSPPPHMATPDREVGDWSGEDVDVIREPEAVARLIVDERLFEKDGPPPAPAIDAIHRLGGLRYLAIRSQALTDVTALGGLDRLEVLILDGSSRVSRLPPLRGLPALVHLSLHGTALADLEPLGEAPRLRVLDLGQTAVEDLAPLRKQSALVELSLAGIFAADLTPLTALPALAALDLSHLPAQDYSALHSLPCLRRLVIDFARGFKLTDLPSGPLEVLSARGTGLVDLRPLSQRAALRELWLGHNHELVDLEPLASLKQLQFLDLTATAVTTLDPLIGLPALKRVVLTRTAVDEAEREQFRQARPEVELDDHTTHFASPFGTVDGLFISPGR